MKLVLLAAVAVGVAAASAKPVWRILDARYPDVEPRPVPNARRPAT
jgi:hypothetical protein